SGDPGYGRFDYTFCIDAFDFPESVIRNCDTLYARARERSSRSHPTSWRLTGPVTFRGESLNFCLALFVLQRVNSRPGRPDAGRRSPPDGCGPCEGAASTQREFGRAGREPIAPLSATD